jgi:hypothetical protein
MQPADFPAAKRRLIADTVQRGHRDLVVRWIAMLLWETLEDPFALVDLVAHDGATLRGADEGAGTTTTRFPRGPLAYP